MFVTSVMPREFLSRKWTLGASGNFSYHISKVRERKDYRNYSNVPQRTSVMLCRSLKQMGM